MTSEERREARYHRRQAGREARRRKRSEDLGGIAQAFSFRKMFKWGKKCCNNVRWKQSTQNFERHLFSGTARRRREVLSGKWRPKPGAHFTLRERGKVRPIDAPHINDRQIHKTHTKEVLEPLYTPGMIYYNGASQRGKGLQFHYKGLKKALRKTYRESGRSGYIILMDLKQFFPSAPHAAIYERHRRLIYDPRIRAVADTVVASVPGGVGMPLGVEPSQMEMVSLPSSVDNWIACQLRAKNPAHYMDDYHMGAETKEQAEKFLQATAQRMEDMGADGEPEQVQDRAADQAFPVLQGKIPPDGNRPDHHTRVPGRDETGAEETAVFPGRSGRRQENGGGGGAVAE